GAGKGVWAKYYGNRKAMNAGIGGDRTQHVLWRLENGNIKGIKPKLAVIMIGTNNSRDDSSENIAKGILAIVDKLHTELPQTKVLVLAIFPRGEGPDNANRKVNEGANQIVQAAAGSKNFEYLDIGPYYLTPEGTISKAIMPDLLHLSPPGYAIWAEAIEPKLSEMLGEAK
ncbi:MAG TPA: GDSL-type esterase/lipase family protein, partial [Pirellulales bacterium]|nr:GDSL-type esterase/lipase family protein [Pirellulales bacterium]